YGWRHAKPGNILEFHARMPAKPWSETHVLATNYRCARVIVDASRRVIDNNTRREPKTLRARENAREGLVRFLSNDRLVGRLEGMTTFLRTEKTRADVA